MDKERKQIICQCNHCGNKGYLDIVGHFTNHIVDYYDDEPCYWWDNDWFLLKCPICGDAVLYEECTEEGAVNYKSNGEYDYDVEHKLIYPNPYLVMKNTPSDIISTYESAVKSYSIDKNVTLIAFRLVLEKIAKDKGAKGKKLVDMINDLSKKKILPSTLKDSGSVVRILGNFGAHGDDDILITKNDLLIIKQFVEYIIDYIYEMPAKIEGLTKKFKLKYSVDSSSDETIFDEDSRGEK